MKQGKKALKAPEWSFVKGVAADVKYFWSRKLFSIGLVAVMLLSYVTLLMNPTVGIDDTSFKLYYIDGVSPAMGRWCLYMIEKFLPLDYNPYFVEAVGLLFFCLSITLWTIVFYRLFGERIPMVVYLLFACVMISNPIISEVVVWYVQDGIYLGYGVTALAVLALLEALKTGKSRGADLGYLLLSALFLSVALGFYEAFMIVFLMAAVLIFMLIRVLKLQEYTAKPLEWLWKMGLLGVAGMLFRSLWINGITAVFHLEDQALVLESRGLSDIAALLTGWFDGTRDRDAMVLVLKEFFVKYSIHGILYLPVLLLVLAKLVLIVWGVLQTFRKKDGWILAALAGVLLLPWVLPVLEGTATYYRSSQYVPLLVAFAVLLTGYELYHRGCGRGLRVIGLLLALFLLYRQSYEMNRWLLVDVNKYEDDKRVLTALGLELMAEHDASKPICVIGNRETPKGLLEDVYCPEWSKKYQLVKLLVCAVDERIFDKYNTEDGYAVAETPQLSFINWANKAYYGFDRELIKFWNMHGFDFVEDNNMYHYAQGKKLMKDGPVWPQEGSIIEKEKYILVNFGNF